MEAPGVSDVSAAGLERPLEFDRAGQIKVGLLTLAFVGVFAHVFYNLQHYWLNDADYSHGPLIPFFSIYLVHQHWEQARRAPIRHTWLGMALMLAALATYQYTLWGLEIGYLRPLSMLLCLLGIIIYLCGLPVLRYVWVAWAFLFFAVPLPKSIYFAITDPMRRIAATVATWTLSLFPDLSIERVGSTIEYFYHGKVGHLGVADACSGMRSTMTLCALGVAIAFVSERPWWQRLILIGSCVPIAIFSNFIRVITTCVLYIFVDAKYAGGNYHTLLGLGTMGIALAIFLGVAWVLSNLFVEANEPAAAAGEIGRTS